MKVIKGSIHSIEYESTNKEKSPYWQVYWKEPDIRGGHGSHMDYFTDIDKVLVFMAKLYLQEEQ